MVSMFLAFIIHLFVHGSTPAAFSAPGPIAHPSQPIHAGTRVRPCDGAGGPAD